jgi:hypothetical protein
LAGIFGRFSSTALQSLSNLELNILEVPTRVGIVHCRLEIFSGSLSNISCAAGSPQSLYSACRWTQSWTNQQQPCGGGCLSQIKLSESVPFLALDAV